MKAQFNRDRAGALPASATRAWRRDAPLRPLLAGARARGMADAFELLGVAAVFIDEGGFALHINDRARRRLGPQLVGRRRAVAGGRPSTSTTR